MCWCRVRKPKQMYLLSGAYNPHSLQQNKTTPHPLAILHSPSHSTECSPHPFDCLLGINSEHRLSTETTTHRQCSGVPTCSHCARGDPRLSAGPSGSAATASTRAEPRRMGEGRRERTGQPHRKWHQESIASVETARKKLQDEERKTNKFSELQLCPFKARDCRTFSTISNLVSTGKNNYSHKDNVRAAEVPRNHCLPSVVTSNHAVSQGGTRALLGRAIRRVHCSPSRGQGKQHFPTARMA